MPLFWLFLMATLYTGQNVNAFIVLAFLLGTVYFAIFHKKLILSKDDIPILFFIFYYLIITIINGQNIIGFIIRFVCLPFIVIVFDRSQRYDRLHILKQFRDFIGLTAIYGLVEYIIHFNYMAYFVKIDAVEWIIKMNNAPLYYPSSIFLHYTYFSYVLLVGFILELVLPYKQKIFSILYRLLVVINIFLSQSRIVWLAFLVVFLVNLLFFTSRMKIERKKLIKWMIAFTCFVVFSIVFHFFQFIFSYITQRFISLFSYGLSDGSLGQRVGTLNNWGEYFDLSSVKAIFGSGFGGVSDYLLNYSYFSGYSTADSTITVFLVESGVVGLILFIIAILNLLIHVINVKNEFSRLLLLLIIGTLLTSLTVDFTANYVVLYLFYVVLIVSLMNIRYKE
ncbi:O-antigen ligase family protein [Streptococcus sciuri]|uniref:O-antigen ligase family protein n=1 Tax=Streptococcus sciuri TaxID=2973939 RepID=A0ABT2F5E1_9STRE|nr:O-antigen ligase family protein [Streptococcus sciuri]MCS4487688.1 O-antigen ligase family protein [Streptococcus sciuri]